MIDRKTGEIVIEDSPMRPGPQLTRSEFQSSLPANAYRVLIENEPFCSFSLGDHEIYGLLFTVSLWFYGEKLESIDLAHSTDELGWYEKDDLKRKRVHDKWLKSMLGSAPYVYGWGSISSDHDIRSGGSSIVIRYSWQGKPWPLR